MRHAGARETVAHVDELARGAVQLTLASVREMAALASSTQREALAVLARRLQADLLGSGKCSPPYANGPK